MSERRLRVAFMGSPDFAVPALHALHSAGHHVVAVYTQPARPAGRGQKPLACPVQRAAEALGLTVRSPERLRRNTAEHADFAALGLDVAVVAAYGLILPQPMLDSPVRGCLNIHASLLPRWRGASPIQSAIAAGDSQSGVTIMRMEAGLDTGPMLLSEAVPITAQTTGATLHDDLAAIGARLILRVLAENPPPRPQPSGETYAAKLTRDDGRIDWSQSAEVIARRIRAFDPWPGAFTTIGEKLLKIRAVDIVPGATGAPGAVLTDDLLIACGSGALRPRILQLAGRTALDRMSFLRGHPIAVGTRFG
jgi:methionyl-tRNA formyltransferase